MVYNNGKTLLKWMISGVKNPSAIRLDVYNP